ncbi:agmatinase [Caldinitratiruptor microaerophilus]|uniref:Agmatinase n=1 Tax=Caldinitratiruptor microaerophilus TaxID=671077 RepID=A0AA35CKL3_9FIRM|nr:agmatinase [Caldinitratiruptor microaerophilus]BDG60143.1 agmatinase [Caldinitratiruptor microaerophilus]
MPKYQPANSLESPRFSGVRTFMRLPHVRTTEDVDFALVGIPFDDATTHRSGARFGPEAIRRSSIMLRPWNPALDIEIFRYLSGVDYGDVPVVPGYIEDTYERIVQTFTPLFAAGVIPLGMGGDHSVTLGELRACAKVHGPVALVHVDAHLDTLDEYFGRKYNHGTPFRRAVEEGLLDVAHSIQVGIRGSNYGPEDYVGTRELGFELITMYEVQDIGVPAVIERIRRRVGDRKAFFTFDIDAVDPAYAPGTGTTEVGGFTSREALQLVRGLQGLNFVGFDVVEVLPAYDPGEITAYLAANILYEMISLVALQRRAALAVGRS